MIDASNYNDILSIISSIQDSDKKKDIITKLLNFAAETANADGYFFYTISPTKYITLEQINISSINLNIIGTSCDKIRPPIFIPDIKNKKKTIEACTLSNEIIN